MNFSEKRRSEKTIEDALTKLGLLDSPKTAHFLGYYSKDYNSIEIHTLGKVQLPNILKLIEIEDYIKKMHDMIEYLLEKNISEITIYFYLDESGSLHLSKSIKCKDLKFS